MTLDELIVEGFVICHHNDDVNGVGLFGAQFNERKLTGTQRPPGRQ